ncbi:MAG TPA: hypothetical protein VIJ92_00830 [Ginsengibacter sp.]
MKTTSKLFALGFLLCITFVTQAQVTSSSRPTLFTSFSTNIPASVAELDKAFTAAPGSSIQFNFSNKLPFSGIVLSSVQRYSNLSSVIIKSALLQNALLSISRRINDDNTITYVGRIINEKYADGYELIKDNTGNYSFNKIKTQDLIQDF